MMHIAAIFNDTSNATQGTESKGSSNRIIRIHHNENSSHKLIHGENFVQVLLAFLHYPKDEQTQEVAPKKRDRRNFNDEILYSK